MKSNLIETGTNQIVRCDLISTFLTIFWFKLNSKIRSTIFSESSLNRTEVCLCVEITFILTNSNHSHTYFIWIYVYPRLFLAIIIVQNSIIMNFPNEFFPLLYSIEVLPCFSVFSRLLTETRKHSTKCSKLDLFKHLQRGRHFGCFKFYP